MPQRIRIGLSGEQRTVVGSEHVIDFADRQMPAVLSTPALIWLLEHAAREAVLPYLTDGESTVGVRVEIDHLAATPLGKEITCRARVVLVDGDLISFQLEARDEQELVARGFHRLRIIDVARFAGRVARKS